MSKPSDTPTPPPAEETVCPSVLQYGGGALRCMRTDNHPVHEGSTGNGFNIKWPDAEDGKS